MKFTNCFVVVVVFFLFPFVSSAQVTYQKTFGDVAYNVFNDVCATTNNELVTAGYWTSSSAMNPVQPFLTQVDGSGNIIWSKEYASPGVGRAASVAATADGGFLAAGKIDTIIGTGGSDDGYVLKVDENGDVEWMTIIGSADDEEFTRVYESQLGDVIAIGTSHVQATGDEYFWFVKMDSLGTVINSFVYFPTANAEAHALGFHPDGGYVIGGIGRVNFIDEAYLFKISSTGVLEWYKSYGTFAGSESIKDLIMLSDNSIVFVGTRYQADRDIFIGKADATGQLLWIKDYGGADHDDASRILEYSSGGFIVSGWTEDLDGATGPMLFKTNATGDLVWTHVIGNGLTTGNVGLVQFPNNTIAMAGTILPDQGTGIGFINQVNLVGEGCNYTSVALPAISPVSSTDTPVVWASIGPSSTSSYNPTVGDVILADSTACSNTSLNEQVGESPVKLYPNPADDALTIKIGEFAKDIKEVALLDMTGKELTRLPISNEIHVDVSKYASGVYFISVATEHGLFREKVIIQ